MRLYFPSPKSGIALVGVLALATVFFLSPFTSYGDSQAGPEQLAGLSARPTSQALGLDPRSGPPGSRISVSGSGFRGFAQVESITLGGLNILGNRTVNTDQDGSFQIDDLIVPGLDPGIVSLVIKVGTGDLETTVSGTFEVTAPTTQSGPALPADEALAPLGDALERIFHFDNATKTWSFFDPRPDFADFNTLTEVVAGQVYWIKVTRSVTVTLNARQRQLTCVNEGTPRQDCWNLLGW